MFESLAEWCAFTVSISRFVSKNIAGDAVYAPAVEYTCYRVDEDILTVDANNKTCISTNRVYLDASIQVSIKDVVTFPNEATQYAIKRISAYYDGATGTKSLLVLYL